LQQIHDNFEEELLQVSNFLGAAARGVLVQSNAGNRKAQTTP